MKPSPIRFWFLAAALAIAPGLRSAPTVDPKAEAVVKNLAATLAAAKSVAVKGTRSGDSEILNEGSGTTKFEVGILRPGFIRGSVDGDLAFSMVSDGVNLSWFEPHSNTYGQMKSAPTIDGAVDIVKANLSFGFPVGDLLANEAYARNVKEDTSVTYAGTEKVGDHVTDHVTLDSPRATVDLFVDQASHLLQKMVVTKKDPAKAYHSEIKFASWNLDAGLKPADFGFKVPAGAERIEPAKGAAEKKGE
jgi:hypothetical protein